MKTIFIYLTKKSVLFFALLCALTLNSLALADENRAKVGLLINNKTNKNYLATETNRPAVPGQNPMKILGTIPDGNPETPGTLRLSSITLHYSPEHKRYGNEISIRESNASPALIKFTLVKGEGFFNAILDNLQPFNRLHEYNDYNLFDTMSLENLKLMGLEKEYHHTYNLVLTLDGNNLELSKISLEPQSAPTLKEQAIMFMAKKYTKEELVDLKTKNIIPVELYEETIEYQKNNRK